MAATTTRGVRDVTTPYGLARINYAGRVLWAEWEVWRHSAELVASGLWTSRLAGSPTRQRSEFFMVEANA